MHSISKEYCRMHVHVPKAQWGQTETVEFGAQKALLQGHKENGGLHTHKKDPKLPKEFQQSIYFLLFFFYFTILHWFCHTSTCICHGCTRVPHPETPSHLPPYSIPLGHLSVPALSTLYHASNLGWQFVSHVIFYMFQCHSPKSSHLRPLPQSPKDCSVHLCLLLSCIQGYRYHLSTHYCP